jgi:uncharacterized protein YcnI
MTAARARSIRREPEEQPMNRRKPAVLATTALALLGLSAGAAQAHVTVQPTSAPAGGFARLDVRVPSEDPVKPTTKVVVQMPSGFADASYEPVAGWRTTVVKHKLATPLKAADGDTLTEELARITFTATGGGLRPGQFQDFGLSLGLPAKPAGTKLTFKALQTYRGGEVVRWIGAPGSEHPAPEVTLVAAPVRPQAEEASAASVNSKDDGDGDGNGLAVVALVVGGLGLLAGLTGLIAGRRAAGS